MLHAVESGQVLYSRYTDGARPVRVLDKGYEVLGDDGHPAVYTTAQSLLAELTGHPTGRHWSLDRYFKVGKHAPVEAPGVGNVLDLFPALVRAPTPSGILLLEPLAPPILGFRKTDSSITVPSKKRQESAKTVENVVSRASVSRTKASGLVISGPIGIDLVNRSHEVRKLLFKGFGRKIFSAGYDAEDVLQEVYRGLLARNKGKCPWDPSKSSFGHYVYMVCGCVLSNYHRKQRRIREFEQSGLTGYSNGQWGVHDAASNTTIPAPETLSQKGYLLNEAADDLVDFMLDMPRGDSTEARLAIEVLPYVSAGTSRAAIASELGVSAAAVSRAVSFLRKTARIWQATFKPA